MKRKNFTLVLTIMIFMSSNVGMCSEAPTGWRAYLPSFLRSGVQSMPTPSFSAMQEWVRGLSDSAQKQLLAVVVGVIGIGAASAYVANMKSKNISNKQDDSIGLEEEFKKEFTKQDEKVDAMLNQREKYLAYLSKNTKNKDVSDYSVVKPVEFGPVQTIDREGNSQIGYGPLANEDPSNVLQGSAIFNEDVDNPKGQQANLSGSHSKQEDQLFAVNAVRSPVSQKVAFSRSMVIKNDYSGPIVYKTSANCNDNSSKGRRIEANSEEIVFGTVLFNEQKQVIRMVDDRGIPIEGFCIRTSGVGSKKRLRPFTPVLGREGVGSWIETIQNKAGDYDIDRIVLTIEAPRADTTVGILREEWSVTFDVKEFVKAPMPNKRTVPKTAAVVQQGLPYDPTQVSQLNQGDQLFTVKANVSKQGRVTFPDPVNQVDKKPYAKDIFLINAYGAAVIYKTARSCSAARSIETIVEPTRDPVAIGTVSFDSDGKIISIKNKQETPFEGFCLKASGPFSQDFSNLSEQFDGWKKEIAVKAKKKDIKNITLTIKPSNYWDDWKVEPSILQ